MLDSNPGRKAAAAALLACLLGAGHAQSIPMHHSRDLSGEQYKARDLSVEQPRRT